MSLPTDVPNTVSSPIVYPKHMSNNWGHYMNDNFLHIATKIDALKVDVANKTKNIELSVANHFAVLKDVMNKAAEEYSLAVKTGRKNAIDILKADIDSYVASAVGDMTTVTKSQLSEINEIRSNLLASITNIQSNFLSTRAYIDAGIQRITKAVDSESQTTAAAKLEVITKVKVVRDSLMDHISDFDNPHEFDSSQADNKPVYQPDPVGIDAIFTLKDTDQIEIEADEDDATYADIAADITGDSQVTISGLSVLHQNILGKYIVLDPNPEFNFAGSFYRFGHNPSVIETGITADRAIEHGGDIAAVSTNLSYPLSVRLTWLGDPSNNGVDDFNIILFANNNPVAGDTVTVSYYPYGANEADAAPRLITTTIGRINYTNKDTVVDAILKYAYPSTKIDLSSGFVAMDTLSDPNLIHWADSPTITAGSNLKVINFYNISSTHEMINEPKFPVPIAIGRLPIGSWGLVDAVAGSVNTFDTAIYYNSVTDYLHVVFAPDSNQLVHDYAIQFQDNTNPMVDGTTVNIIRYLWDLKIGNVTVNYSPVLVAQGTAVINV